MAVAQKVRYGIIMWPRNPTAWSIPEKKKIEKHSSTYTIVITLFTIAKGRDNPVFINRWMSKQNVVCAYSGMVYRKEWNSDTCSNVNEPWKQLS